MTEAGELAAAPLQVARGDVVQHQGAILEVPLGQRRLDPGLLLHQPIEAGVKRVLVDRAEAEDRRQRTGRGARSSMRAVASLEAGSKTRACGAWCWSATAA